MLLFISSWFETCRFLQAIAAAFRPFKGLKPQPTDNQLQLFYPTQSHPRHVTTPWPMYPVLHTPVPELIPRTWPFFLSNASRYSSAQGWGATWSECRYPKQLADMWIDSSHISYFCDRLAYFGTIKRAFSDTGLETDFDSPNHRENPSLDKMESTATPKRMLQLNFIDNTSTGSHMATGQWK